MGSREIQEWILHLDMQINKIIKMKDNILILKRKKKIITRNIFRKK